MTKTNDFLEKEGLGRLMRKYTVPCVISLLAAALSMLREIVFGTGLPLVLPLFFGLNGIVFFMPAADILTFIASAAVTVHTYRKLLR